MKKCIRDLTSNNVKLLVRSCEGTYEEEQLTQEGIKVEELIFPDGQLPEQQVIDRWLDIVDDFFDGPSTEGLAAQNQN